MGGGATGLGVALDAAAHSLAHPETLPSARVLQAVRAQPNGSFVAFVRGRSKDIRQAMLAMPLSNELQGRYEAMADASVVEQKTAEDSDEVDFDHYLQNYLSAASA